MIKAFLSSVLCVLWLRIGYDMRVVRYGTGAISWKMVPMSGVCESSLMVARDKHFLYVLSFIARLR